MPIASGNRRVNFLSNLLICDNGQAESCRSDNGISKMLGQTPVYCESIELKFARASTVKFVYQNNRLTFQTM